MTNWDKQNSESIYPDVTWSRPETTGGAGKLLIVGGSSGNMAILAKHYSEAEKARAGTVHLLVPDSLAKVTKQIPFVQYGKSNRSGGFAKESLGEFLAAGSGMDCVLLSGDLGKNSETSLVLENFLAKYSGLLSVTTESLESLANPYEHLISRPDTLLFLNIKQLVQLGIYVKSTVAITSNMPNENLASSLKSISSEYPITIILDTDDFIWVTRNGRVGQCQKQNYGQIKATIWAMQQPTKIYEAIISSII